MASVRLGSPSIDDASHHRPASISGSTDSDSTESESIFCSACEIQPFAVESPQAWLAVSFGDPISYDVPRSRLEHADCAWCKLLREEITRLVTDGGESGSRPVFPDHYTIFLALSKRLVKVEDDTAQRWFRVDVFGGRLEDNGQSQEPLVDSLVELKATVYGTNESDILTLIHIPFLIVICVEAVLLFVVLYRPR
jgi:hypothetical protein